MPGVISRIAETVARALVWGAAGALAAGQLGRLFRSADSFNHLLPIWLASGLAAAVALLAMRRALTRGQCGAVVVMIGCAALQAAPEFRGASTAPGPTAAAPDLRLVVFNFWKGNRTPKRATD